MIRQATRYDKTQIIEMLRMFRDESPIQQYKDTNNEEYISSLLDSILAGQGIIYIKENVGMIIGLICPTVWDNKTLAMYELAWYVKPSCRNTTAGYRLLQAYIEYGNKIKELGRIKFFTISKLSTTPSVKYEHFGFVKTDENWMQ